MKSSQVSVCGLVHFKYVSKKPDHFFSPCCSVRCADVCPCPREGEDPYSMENIPENLSYELKMRDGIIYVYENAAALKENRPHCLPYPDLETFAIDMSHVLAMIADGPT